jgi:hypothetical protein
MGMILTDISACFESESVFSRGDQETYVLNCAVVICFKPPK